MPSRTNGKRKAQTIDLTASDDENRVIASQRKKQQKTTQTPLSPAETRATTSSSASQSSSSSQSYVHPSSSAMQHSASGRAQGEMMGLGDEDSDANEVIFLSQDANDTTGEFFEFYCAMNIRVVGLQFYTGFASVGEHVIVKREPDNRFDSNAIRVNNVMGNQIGHIPRVWSAKLAPFLDSGELVASGELMGTVAGYDVPIKISLYGTGDAVAKPLLMEEMEKAGLPVAGLIKKQKAEQEKRIAESKKRAKEKQELYASQHGLAGGWRGSSQGSSSQPPPMPEVVPTMDSILKGAEQFSPRELGKVVERYGAGEDVLSKMPATQTPDSIATTLLPYQSQGLCWLLGHENPQLPAAGEAGDVQLWKRREGKPEVFDNVATRFALKGTEPELASGGILADDMGLGKTLQMIALIAADLEMQKSLPNDVATKGRPTLIVAPVSVMSNWSTQIARHVKIEHALRVLIYHGPLRRPIKPEDSLDYDVIITSYGTLSEEYLPRASKTPPEIPRASGLYSTEYRRVILDEGHCIRTATTKAARAAFSVLARSRWVLTGTPIVNSLKDLQSLVRFVGLTGGLERFEVFNDVLIRPLKASDPDAKLLLQALMGSICLRRRKDMAFIDLSLPKLTEYIHKVPWLPHEREKYDSLGAEAKGVLHNYMGRKDRDPSKTQATYCHLLEVLLRLRQVCNHWKLCGERVTNLMKLLEDQKVVELTPENRKALQAMLQLSIESRDDCPVCLEAVHEHEPVITHCAHVFGKSCIGRVVETQHKCPMCRAELENEACLVEPAVEEAESDAAAAAAAAEREALNLSVDGDTSSSKIEALIAILRSSRSDDPSTKTVVFSQWTSFLDIVQVQLGVHGFKFARIDGKMNAKKRDAALAALDADPECSVMLASLSVGAVGLNLVAANQVVLTDSWWAPAIEDQAVDRVHRLGQKRETTVHRLVMEDSVENMVLDIQAEKRKLMMAAFQEKSNKRTEGTASRIGDIERLLR